MSGGRVNVGVIGMGIGKPNAKALAADPRGRVAALCDLDEGRMREFATELPDPPRLFADYRAMCADPELDAVFVGSPNQLHVPMILEAVRNGKHVLCTKPLADSVAHAWDAVRAVEDAGVVNMMSLSMRFDDTIQHLGRMARDGGFGELYYGRARSIRRAGIPDWNPGFIRAGGGAYRDMAVHVLDAAWWVMGMPDPVSATGVAGAKFGPHGKGYMHFKAVPESYSRQYAADDYGAGFIRFANGAALHVESFWASHMAWELQIELFGTEAGAIWKPMTISRTEDGKPVDEQVPFPDKPDSWTRIAGHFLSCILDGTPCAAPLRHGAEVQRMLEAVLESAATGREIRLDTPA